MPNLCRSIALLAGLLVLPTPALSAAPVGARPADAPPAPVAPAGKAPGAAVDPGPTLENPKGDKQLTITLLGIVTDKLKAEYAASLRDPRRPLRERSTYFLDHPAELHQEKLLVALEKPVGNDARLTAYVRWQLLSGASKKEWDKDLVTRALDLYRRAPLPTPRYGLSDVDRRKLDAMLVAAKDDAMRLTDLVDDAVVKGEESNRVLFAYRDALYDRIPVGYDRFSAGLRDAFERLASGWAPKDLMQRIEEEATVWANSGVGDPKQYAAIAQLVFRLRTERGPKYYAGVGTSRTTKLPYWMTRTEALYEAKKLADLQKLLEEKGGVRRPALDASATR